MQLIKKIASAAIGLLMAGSSVMAGAFGDLSTIGTDYTPEKALVVVGATAATDDVVGAINIAAKLGTLGTSEMVAVGVAAEAGMTGEAAALTTETDKIYLAQDLDVRVNTLTDEDLSTILADGTFTNADTNEDFDYEQTLTIGSRAFTFSDSGNDLIDPALLIDVGTDTSDPLYTLDVNFDKAVDLNDAGATGEEITIGGVTYTIGSGTTSTELELLGGALDVDLSYPGAAETTVTFQGQDVTIELLAVTSGEDVQIKVTAGTQTATDTIAEGSTRTIAGIDVYAKEVNYVGLESLLGTATISLGAEEVYLESGSEVEVGTQKDAIDGTLVTISNEDGGTDFDDVTTISIDVTAEDSDVDHLAEGESFTDPVVGTFKVTLADIPNAPTLSAEKGTDTNADRKEIEISRASDDAAQITFTDKSGNEKTLEFADGPGAGAVELEDDDDYDIKVVEGATLTVDQYTILNSGSYQHFVEITKVNIANDGDNALEDDVSFKDLFTGTTYDLEDKDLDTAADTATITIKGQTYTVETVNPATPSIKIYSSDYTTNAAVYPYLETVSGKDFKVALTEDVAIAETLTTVTDGVAVSSKTYELPTGTIQFRIADADVSVVADDATIEYSIDGGTWTSLAEVLATDGQDVEELDIGTVGYSITATLDTTVAASTLTIDKIAIDPDQGTDDDDEEADAGLLFVEEEDNTDNNNAVIIPMAGDGTYTDVDLAGITFSNANAVEGAGFDDTDYTGNIDPFGVYVQEDSSDTDQDWVVLTYPELQMYASAFVAEVASEISEAAAAGEVETWTAPTLPVPPTGIPDVSDGLAKLDTEVTPGDKGNKNIIVVGGPCVNSLAAELLNVTFPTCGDAAVAAGIPSGGYLIKSYADKFVEGQVALLVAGYEAANTRVAALRVMQSGLTGTEVTG